MSKNLLSSTTSLFSMVKLREQDLAPKVSIRIVFSGVFDSVVVVDCVFEPLIESSRSIELKN